VKRLKKLSFKPIRERDSWALICRPGGRNYVTRNSSSIIARQLLPSLSVEDGAQGNSVAMVSAHADPPYLRIKSVSKKNNISFLQVGVKMYSSSI
jgi:aspartyl aminopeptidase